jgi:hypothetical protein
MSGVGPSMATTPASSATIRTARRITAFPNELSSDALSDASALLANSLASAPSRSLRGGMLVDAAALAAHLLAAIPHASGANADSAAARLIKTLMGCISAFAASGALVEGETPPSLGAPGLDIDLALIRLSYATPTAAPFASPVTIDLKPAASSFNGRRAGMKTYYAVNLERHSAGVRVAAGSANSPLVSVVVVRSLAAAGQWRMGLGLLKGLADYKTDVVAIQVSTTTASDDSGVELPATSAGGRWACPSGTGECLRFKVGLVASLPTSGGPTVEAHCLRWDQAADDGDRWVERACRVVQVRAVAPTSAVVDCACTADGVFVARVRPVPLPTPIQAAPLVSLRRLSASHVTAIAWIAASSATLAAVFVTTLLLAVLRLSRMSRCVWKGHQTSDFLENAAGALGRPFPPQHPLLLYPPASMAGELGPDRNTMPDHLEREQLETGEMAAIVTTTAPGGLFFFTMPHEAPSGLDDGCDNSFCFDFDAVPAHIHRSSAVTPVLDLQPDAVSVIRVASPVQLLPELLAEARLKPPVHIDHDEIFALGPESPDLMHGCFAPDTSPAYQPSNLP